MFVSPCCRTSRPHSTSLTNPSDHRLSSGPTTDSPDVMARPFLLRILVFGGPTFVKRFALCYRTVVLTVPSVPSAVTLVYCGQTVGRINMNIGIRVGIDHGKIVLDRDPAPPPLPHRGTAPDFQPISVVAKWLDGSRFHLVWR